MSNNNTWGRFSVFLWSLDILPHDPKADAGYPAGLPNGNAMFQKLQESAGTVQSQRGRFGLTHFVWESNRTVPADLWIGKLISGKSILIMQTHSFEPLLHNYTGERCRCKAQNGPQRKRHRLLKRL